MTLTAVVGLTFDGESVQDFAGGIWFEIITGLAEVPAVRGTDTTIPAAAGRLAGDRVNDILPIELRGHVRAGTGIAGETAERTDHYANLRIVRQLFRPNRDRAPLVATLPGGTVLTIQARPLNIVSEAVVVGEYTEVSVSLEGDDDWVAS